MSKLFISTPEYYISEPDAIESLGDTLVKYIGKKKSVLLVWSASAKKKIKETVASQLNSVDYDYSEVDFSGYPSERQANKIADIARKENSDALIAFGGGRVMDVTKAAGTFSSLPVVTVPTIAATCAAWAAVSILYQDNGDVDRAFMNPHSPRVIIADTHIISEAPIRYIKAGIADTLAKWYEPIYTDGLDNIVAKHGAWLAKDIIEKKALNVIEDLKKGNVTDNTVQIVDSIIYLAGFVGSFIGAFSFGGMAHPFYHSSRGIPKVREKLHGEVVSYGLILQGVYEGKSSEELFERIKRLDELDNLFTSAEVGYTSEEDYELVIDRLLTHYPGTTAADGTAEQIRNAFNEADKLIVEYRRQK